MRRFCISSCRKQLQISIQVVQHASVTWPLVISQFHSMRRHSTWLGSFLVLSLCNKAGNRAVQSLFCFLVQSLFRDPVSVQSLFHALYVAPRGLIHSHFLVFTLRIERGRPRRNRPLVARECLPPVMSTLRPGRPLDELGLMNLGSTFRATAVGRFHRPPWAAKGGCAVWASA